MIIDKHRKYLHTFQKGNEQAINIVFIQFYFKDHILYTRCEKIIEHTGTPVNII
jgi:hypothetical protein